MTSNFISACESFHAGYSPLNPTTMASAKLPPRQKMIGMMYLVLTALLALNVSREILNSFVVVNTGLENTGKGFTHNTSQYYAEFDRLKLYDPKRVAENYAKAQEAKTLTTELNDYIAKLKKRLIRETEGFKKKEEDTIQLGNVEGKDDLNTSTQIMIGNSEDGSGGCARELKNKLKAYREKMLSLLDEEDQKRVHLNIDTRNPPRTEDESSRNWELNYFFNTPLAAAVTILTKFETDAKDAESEVVEHLLAKSSGETIPFDTVAAKVVSESNYVLLGEKFKADIFIAAFNKTLKTDVISGDYDPATKLFRGTVDSVPVVRGMGKYSAASSSEGFKKLKGIIRMVSPKGKVFEYPYETEYIVAKPALTVSAEKMNVMYAKLANPISVSVPGVPNDKLSVSIDNGRLIQTGKGKFDVVDTHAGMANVRVMAEMGNGEKRMMGEISFKVKDLPKPTARIGELHSSGRMKQGLLALLGGLFCFYDPSFEFKTTAHVTSFKMMTISRETGLPKETPVTGNLLSEDCMKIIRKLRRNETVSFEKIKALGADGKTVELDPITIIVD
jgi:gliding motility-associated protein GldM